MGGKDPNSSIASDRRPDPKDYTKWEKPLPFNLEDFMTQYNAWKLDGVTHPDWLQELVAKYEVGIKDMIRHHWKISSKTRKFFVAMNEASVWEDKAQKTMFVTRRNLATLDPNFIPELDNYILTNLTTLIEEIRAEVVAVLPSIYANETETADLTAKVAGTSNTDYTFENYGKHLEFQVVYQDEFKAKFAPIEYLRQRELYIQNLVAWEQKTKTMATSPVKGSSNMMNWVAKFRLDASKILIKSNGVARKVVKEYEEQTGKTFTLLTTHTYIPEFVAPQEAQLARVKTNFSYLTADVLFFDNPGGGAEGAPICEKIIDPLLEGLVELGTPLIPPPAMPTFSQEVGFHFDYY